jgi:ribosomal protein L30
MSLDRILEKNITLTQSKSFSGLTKLQKGNLIGLGLGGIGSKSNLFCNASVFGMVKKVNHLLKVSIK